MCPLDNGMPPDPWDCDPGSDMVCTCAGWECSLAPCPIVIDTAGQGFHLTSAENGVNFTFFPGKAPIRLGWTNPTYDNGFLALDRNGNGTIDNVLNASTVFDC
jgi:hypothetical protein